MATLEKIFGKHSVRAVLLRRPEAITALIFAGREDYHSDMIAMAENHGISIAFKSWDDFMRAGAFEETDKHQGVLALVQPRPLFGFADLGLLHDAACVLVLDQLSNPQNFAAVLRGAAFFQADAILFMKNRAVPLTPTVVRYAVGAAECIKLFQLANLGRSLDVLKRSGFWIYGLDERSDKTLAQGDFASTPGGKTAFVIGAEGEGLRSKTKRHCDVLLRIPGGCPGVESLNAGVAATLALYEYYRRQP